MSEIVPPSPAGVAGPVPEDAGASRPGQVRLEAFRGPLEMLLHLVRSGEIDVTTLPIAEIVRQYNEDLALERVVEPESAGEHVVGVSTLIHMKSRRLLPPDPVAAGPEVPIRPEDEILAERAAREDALRGAMEHLQEREAVMELMYLRPAAAVSEFAGEEGIDADLFALLRAFREILKRTGEEETGSMSRERISLVERIHWLMDTLQRGRRVFFKTLFSGISDRVTCILTFLALLEVIRLRLVRAHVSHHQEDILIVLAEETPASAAGDGTDHA